MIRKEGRMSKWWRQLRGAEAVHGGELSRSQYSLVSTSELTPGALRVWTLLPPEVKYDSALEPFRQHYEKEHGSGETVAVKDCIKTRIPFVKSAPLLHNQSTLSNNTFSDGEQIPEELQYRNGGSTQNPRETYIKKKSNKIALAKHYTKITLLVGVWIFFTVIFMMYNEKEEVLKNTYVESKEVKSYILNISDPGLTVMVKLSGPFLSEQLEDKLNDSHKLHVWLERWNLGDKLNKSLEENILDKQVSNTWSLILQKDLDFLPGEERSGLVSLSQNSSTSSVYVLKMQTDSPKPVPFTFCYTLNPLDFKTGVIYAFLLLLGLYTLIISEVINRTMAAVLMSTTSLAVLAMVGERPTLQELVSWLEVETLVLLFSMMLLVAIMAESGMFDALAVCAFQVTKGKIWPLIALLCITTALVSTFLDNVTTVLLMAPVTIRLCEVTGLDPVPILMSMVLFSNIGGTATPVGDPPNVIISSNKLVKQVGINFTNFTLHMSLGILLVCVQTYLQLRYWHIDVHLLRHSEPRDIQELRHQLAIWRRAAQSLPHVSSDERVVRMRLERKIDKLTEQLSKREEQAKTRACDKEVFQTTLADLKDKYKIYDKILLLKASVATFFAIAVFFMHSIPELSRVSLGWTALLAAILLLILVDREDLEPVLRKVEWSTLLFFAALFVNMEALSKLGLIEFIGDITESVILAVDENSRLAVAILLIVWVSGLTLAFLDNIPLTTMMVRVVTSLGANPAVGLPLPPLIWALSFGTCLGGNGTLIGASANVVCAGVAEQHGYKFTFMQFFKIGFPVMIGHLIVVSIYLLICHCVFQWHL